MNVKEIWSNLFDNSLEKYKDENVNIRNLAMILHVFQLEFKKVGSYITELQQKNELQLQDLLKYEKKLDNQTCSCKKNIRSPLKTVVDNKSPKFSPKKSDESIVNEIKNIHGDTHIEQISDTEANLSKENDKSLFVDDSFNAFELSRSPPLGNFKSRSLRANLRNQSFNNKSIIQGTPVLKINKTKKLKQSRLPMTFSGCSTEKNNLFTFKKEHENPAKTADNKNETIDTDETYCLTAQKFDSPKIDDDNDDDINNLELNNILDKLGSTSPVKKKLKLDNSYDRLPIIQKSPEFAFKRETARKKADRMKLKGWDCPDCEKYYANMNLPEEELQKRKQQCSKHRSNFNPFTRLTPEGFWNPDFTPTQNSFAFDL